MNLYLAAVVALTAVVHTTEGCCTPKKWEGFVGELGGIARGGRHEMDEDHPHPHPHHHPHPPPHPKLFGGSFAMAYNAKDEKIAVVAPAREGEVKYISNFKKEKAYVVMNTTCRVFNMSKPFQEFCTGNSTASGSAILGGSLSVDTYRMRFRELEAHFALTSNSCIPVSETWFGRVKRDYIILNVGFINVTKGIKDPSVFDHPKDCKRGHGDMDSYLQGLGVADVARYLALNKFAGEAPESGEKYERNYNTKNNVF